MKLILFLGWLLLTFSTTAQPTANTTLPPKTRLLTTSLRTGDTEVFWVNPVSGDAFNITKAPASEERYPVWSPDGRRVAFTSNRTGSYQLFMSDADGKNVRQLTPPSSATVVYYFPSWTADGSQIWFNLADDTRGKAVIGYVTPHGKTYREVADGRDGAISPDGNTIAFTKRVTTGFCLFAMNADGSHVRQLTQHEDDIGAVAPTWSPNGQQILYSDQVGDALELFVYDLPTKQVRQLTRLGQISSSGAWSPDGRWVTFRLTGDAYWRNAAARDKAYLDKQPDKRPVWIIGIDGTNPHVLETLRYHCAIDGSRAAWWPGAR